MGRLDKFTVDRANARVAWALSVKVTDDDNALCEACVVLCRADQSDAIEAHFDVLRNEKARRQESSRSCLILSRKYAQEYDEP